MHPLAERSVFQTLLGVAGIAVSPIQEKAAKEEKEAVSRMNRLHYLSLAPTVSNRTSQGPKMGYSRSPDTLRKIEAALQPLALGEPCVWTTDTPATWAYQVREALFIARLHPDQFPALAMASATFIIGVQDSRHVYAKRIPPSREAQVVPAVGAMQQQRREEAGSKTLAQAFGFPDIVQFWIDCQPTNEPIRILDAPLSDGELEELASWAAALPRPLMVLRPKGTTSLTIAPSDPQVPAEARIQPKLGIAQNKTETPNAS